MQRVLVTGADAFVEGWLAVQEGELSLAHQPSQRADCEDRASGIPRLRNRLGLTRQVAFADADGLRSDGSDG